MSKLYYVGSPYTHKYKTIVNQRMTSFSEVMAKLIKHKVHPVSPLMNHFLETQVEIDFPLTWDYWQEYSKILLERCDALIIIKSEGWEESSGVVGEIKIAQDNNIPIFYVNNAEDLDAIIN